MNVTITIPDILVTELNLIALAEGFPTAKALVIHWLKAKVKAARVNKATSDASSSTGTQADTDTGGIV